MMAWRRHVLVVGSALQAHGTPRAKLWRQKSRRVRRTSPRPVPGDGESREQWWEGGRGQVSPRRCYHPLRDVLHQVCPEPSHSPVVPATAPGVRTSQSQKLQRGGWAVPPPELTAPPPRSQRVRRRPATLPERRHLLAEPALRLPARLHRRALRAASLRLR